MEVVKILMSGLHSDTENARKHGRQNISSIKANLMEFGQYQPLVIQKSTMKILVGNGRYAALVELAAEGKWRDDKVDCVVLDVDEQKARLLSLADNRASEIATWNGPVLASMLQQLESDFNIEKFGFDPGFAVSMFDKGTGVDDGKKPSELPPPEVTGNDNRADYIVLTYEDEEQRAALLRRLELPSSYKKKIVLPTDCEQER